MRHVWGAGTIARRVPIFKVASRCSSTHAATWAGAQLRAVCHSEPTQWARQPTPTVIPISGGVRSAPHSASESIAPRWRRNPDATHPCGSAHLACDRHRCAGPRRGSCVGHDNCCRSCTAESEVRARRDAIRPCPPSTVDCSTQIERQLAAGTIDCSSAGFVVSTRSSYVLDQRRARERVQALPVLPE